jgi:hypothetical protein
MADDSGLIRPGEIAVHLELLATLPGEHDIRAIDLGRELRESG